MNMILKLTLSILPVFFMIMPAYSQTARQPLPRTINIPSKNHISPSLSGDGRMMVYVSNYTNSGKMLMKYTYLNDDGQWSEPAELTTVNREGYDFLGGHWLTYDGSMLFFTSKRGPGIGKYDIFYSGRRGNYWTPPQNIGKPINSESNDGHPSLTPDGRYLYFMRCETMDNYAADGCELFVAERRSENYWHEPVRLPHPINTGSEATPRIMPDGETLMFASKRAGGKGGYDIYQSRNIGGEWTKPEPCYYLNNQEDNLFVSVPAHGELAYFSTLFRNYFTIIETRIPEELKPKKVVLVQGKFMDAQTRQPLEGVIQVYDARTRQRDQFIKTRPDGSFFALIKGDGVYDFSVITRENKHGYFSRLYDIENLDQSQIETLEIMAEPVKQGALLHEEAIEFEPYTANLKKESGVALLRLVKFLKDNSGIGLEISAHIDELKTDTIASNPDLTEIIIDTLFLEPVQTPPDTSQFAANSARQHPEAIVLADTALINPSEEAEKGFDYARVAPVKTELRYKLVYTYHNDRTQKQADAIVNHLIALGAPAYLLEAKGYGDSKRLAPNTTDENRAKNRRIEIRMIRR